MIYNEGNEMPTSTKTVTAVSQAVYDILSKADAESLSPANNIMALGNCLMTIGETLAGVPVEQARRIIQAASILHGVSLDRKVIPVSRPTQSSQLPDGMEHCTIRFKECPKGHGRLAADNWIDHGCLVCEIQKLGGTVGSK